MPGFDDVGAALALLRKAAGLNQEQLSERMGLGGSTSISSIENGNPTASTIQRYLAAVGRTPADLVAAMTSLEYRPPEIGLEVREPSAPDPLDEQTDALVDEFRKLVEMVKSRGKGS